MIENKVLLKRENDIYEIGICLIKKELNELVEYLHILHPNELEYYNNLKFDKRKTSYLLGRISAKKAICQMLPQKINFDSFYLGFGVFQFPVVKNLPYGNVNVSISHCRTLGISLAFPEEHPLGIDIEKITDDNNQIFQNVITKEEYDLVKGFSMSVNVGSTLIWSVKESLSKVLKTGLTIDFKMLELKSLERNNLEYVGTFRYFSQYKVVSRKIGDHICSIVLPKNTSYDFYVFWNALIRVS